MKLSRELVKGSTSILILSLLSGEDMYGYQMTQELKKKTDGVFEMREGTLYPMLHSLEESGAVEAYWVQSDGGKQRKYYRLTKAGKSLLKEKKAEWEIFTGAVGTVIGEAFSMKGDVCYE